MVKATLVLAMGTIGTLIAADFAGRWTGKMETNGSSVSIFLTLTGQSSIQGAQQAGNVTGMIATGDESKPTAPIQNAEIKGDKLTFEVQDNAGRIVTFHLTLTGTTLTGESTVGGQISKVSLSQMKGGFIQVGGGFGDRVGPIVDKGGGAGQANSDGVFRVGGGVSPPALIHKVDPEYSEEARAAKYQGTVILHVEIGPDGTASNIKVVRSLGMGLDEKAVEAVKQWKFRPGQKDGQPVTVTATIVVNFRQ
jgi:TonB family protein